VIHGIMCVVGGGIALAISILSMMANIWFGLFVSLGMLFSVECIRKNRINYLLREQGGAE